MTQYTHINLCEFVKADAKKIKKENKGKFIPLTKIQNLISEFFGYRHFHELKVVSNKSNDFKSRLVDISMLDERKLNNFKLSYRSYLSSVFSIDNNSLFSLDRVIAKREMLIYKGSDITNTYDLVRDEIFIGFSNNEYENLIFDILRENEDSFKFKHLAINYNRLVFNILRYIKSDNFQRDYVNFFLLDDLIEFISNNPYFNCPELALHLKYIGIIRSEIDGDFDVRSYEIHGYTTMQIYPYVYDSLMKWSENKEEIPLSEIIKCRENLRFIYCSDFDSISKVFDKISFLCDEFDGNQNKTPSSHLDELFLWNCRLNISSSNKNNNLELSNLFLDKLEIRKIEDKLSIILIGDFENSNEKISKLHGLENISLIYLADMDLNDAYSQSLRLDPDIVVINDSLGSLNKDTLNILNESGFSCLYMTETNFKRADFIRQYGFKGFGLVRDIF